MSNCVRKQYDNWQKQAAVFGTRAEGMISLHHMFIRLSSPEKHFWLRADRPGPSPECKHQEVQIHQAHPRPEVLHPHLPSREGSDGMCTDWLRENGCILLSHHR